MTSQIDSWPQEEKTCEVRDRQPTELIQDAADTLRVTRMNLNAATKEHAMAVARWEEAQDRLDSWMNEHRDYA